MLRQYKLVGETQKKFGEKWVFWLLRSWNKIACLLSWSQHWCLASGWMCSGGLVLGVYSRLEKCGIFWNKVCTKLLW